MTAAPSEDERRALRLDLDCGVADLVRMARLAERQLYEAVGELSYVDGKCVEPPDAEAAELAVFVVSQMADMAKRFEELYYSSCKSDPCKLPA
jgi:hypothetical protein